MAWQNSTTVRSLGLDREEVQVKASSVFLARVYVWMMIGLGITGLTAFFTAHTQLGVVIAKTNLFWALFVAELALVWFLAARIDALSAKVATALFIGYSVLNGLTFSIFFIMYTGCSVASTFLVTAGMFGALSVYGLVTKRDLTGLGSFMFMGLVGLVLASLVNTFLIKSSAAGLAIAMVGVIIFVGLTAYDTQKIKELGENGIMNGGEAAIQKYAILGALSLYLDFINLFILLLRIFGGSRD